MSGRVVLLAELNIKAFHPRRYVDVPDKQYLIGSLRELWSVTTPNFTVVN
jgi:hypothetical protein